MATTHKLTCASLRHPLYRCTCGAQARADAAGRERASAYLSVTTCQRCNGARTEHVRANAAEQRLSGSGGDAVPIAERYECLVMSFFNTQMICLACEAAEKAHPAYVAAHEAEVAACLRGDYNFPGVGLPVDLEVGDANPVPV